MTIRTLLAASLCGLAACADEPRPAAAVQRDSPATAAPQPEPPSGPLLSPQLPRLRDQHFREAVAAYERGDFARADELRLAAPDSLDVELLGARLAAARGDEVAAVRAVESLRARHPGEGRVFATAAEIHAAAGRLSSAEEEIREGLALAGPTPDLTRARGVLALCREGGARKGLEHLLAALDLEPGLEFSARPLSQAHLLLGNAALAAEQPLEAAGHAKAALKALPDELEAERLLADAFAAGGDFERALEIQESLLARGVEVRVALISLHTRAATADLLAGRRERAMERWIRARELGATQTELGFGASALEQAASQSLDRGLERYDAADLAAARGEFEAALRFDPRSREALHHLGVVLYKQGDLAGAAERWARALALSRELGEALPEPVHLNLARAFYQLDRRDEARAVLERYLADAPDGEFAPQTREALERLGKP